MRPESQLLLRGNKPLVTKRMNQNPWGTMERQGSCSSPRRTCLLPKPRTDFSVLKPENAASFFQPHQQTLVPPDLSLPDPPHVLQAAFRGMSHLNELLCTIHPDVRQVHSFVMAHSAEATVNGPRTGPGPARR